MFKNLGVFQSLLEAASYPRDRNGVEEAKDRDAEAGKNQPLKFDRYNGTL